MKGSQERQALLAHLITYRAHHVHIVALADLRMQLCKRLSQEMLHILLAGI